MSAVFDDNSYLGRAEMDEHMSNQEILDALIAINRAHLCHLYKVKDLVSTDKDEKEVSNWIALESIANNASERHKELATKLMENLRECCS